MPVNFFIFELFPETFLEPKLHPCPYHPKSQISSPSLPTYSKLLKHYLHLAQPITISTSFPQLNLSMFILIGTPTFRKRKLNIRLKPYYALVSSNPIPAHFPLLFFWLRSAMTHGSFVQIIAPSTR